jgi:hypothetical protein
VELLRHANGEVETLATASLVFVSPATVRQAPSDNSYGMAREYTRISYLSPVSVATGRSWYFS